MRVRQSPLVDYITWSKIGQVSVPGTWSKNGQVSVPEGSPFFPSLSPIKVGVRTVCTVLTPLPAWVKAWVNDLVNGEVFGGDRPPLATGCGVAIGDRSASARRPRRTSTGQKEKCRLVTVHLRVPPWTAARSGVHQCPHDGRGVHGWLLSVTRVVHAVTGYCS